MAHARDLITATAVIGPYYGIRWASGQLQLGHFDATGAWLGQLGQLSVASAPSRITCVADAEGNLGSGRGALDQRFLMAAGDDICLADFAAGTVTTQTPDAAGWRMATPQVIYDPTPAEYRIMWVEFAETPNSEVKLWAADLDLGNPTELVDWTGGDVPTPGTIPVGLTIYGTHAFQQAGNESQARLGFALEDPGNNPVWFIGLDDTFDRCDADAGWQGQTFPSRKFNVAFPPSPDGPASSGYEDASGGRAADAHDIRPLDCQTANLAGLFGRLGQGFTVATSASTGSETTRWDTLVAYDSATGDLSIGASEYASPASWDWDTEVTLASSPTWGERPGWGFTRFGA